MKPLRTDIYLWSVFAILIVISVGSTPVQGAGPTALSASYIDSSNVLQIMFDQPVFTDSLRIIRRGITLDGDNGGVLPDVTITGGFLSGIPVLSNTVDILVNFIDQNSIETMVDRNKLELVLQRKCFVNAAYEYNEEITAADDIIVSFIEDLKIPTPTEVVYDATINRLNILFTEDVETKRMSLTKIALNGIYNGSSRDVVFSSVNELLVTTAKNSNSIQIDISPNHQEIIEAMVQGSMSLKLDRNAFLDIHHNSNKIIPEKEIYVTVNPDVAPTIVHGGYYNANDNKLEIYFNEKVVTTFWGAETITYEDITLHSGVIQVALSGRKSVSVFQDTSLVIEVLPSDQRLIENLTDKTNLKLTLAAYAVLDAQGNGIREFTLSDNLPLTYEDENPANTPVVTTASYDAVENTLILDFGNITGNTRGIDTISVNLDGVAIDDDNGGSNTDVTLTGGVVHGMKTGVPKFVRRIVIDVTSEDEAHIERIVNKNLLYLTLEPLSFYFESYTKTKNGNHLLETGNIPVQYIADTLATEVSYVKYDYLENRLYFIFNKLIQYDKFLPTGIEISGIKLSGGAIIDSTYTSTITLNVNANDSVSIQNLSLSEKINFQVKINAGTILNLDDVANADNTFQDGDLTASGDTIFVGYGRKFWDRSHETFPTDDLNIPATLKAFGDHSYFFIDDTLWTGWRKASATTWVKYIRQAQIDSMRDAFEIRSPADPTKGIYQICRDVFGHETDTDNDSRIYIFLMNVRDMYGKVDDDALGRLNDYAKAGYFEPRNELPASQYAHSNKVDLLYIDIKPILEFKKTHNAMADMFQRMIIHHTDSDEEQWLEEGMSAIAQKVCGYSFHTYQFPTKKLKTSAENGLTSWVDWTGGLPIDLANLQNSYFFTLYLYEQYGGVDLLKAIAADTSNGLESIDNALAKLGKVTTTYEIFDDYAIACYLNFVGHSIYGDKYGFTEHKRSNPADPYSNPLDAPAIVLIDNWSTDAKWRTSTPWSINFFKLKQKAIPQIIKFNGLNESNLSIQIAPIKDTFTIQKMTLDATKEASLDLSQFNYDSDILITVCNKTDDGPLISPFIITRDDKPSSYVNLSVLQNPSVDRLLDVYVVSKERLFKDVPHSDPVAATTNGIPTLEEGPLVKITINNVTTEVTAERNFTNTEQSMFSYSTEYALSSGGGYQVTVSGQDMSGNDFTSQFTTITAHKMLAKSGGVISDAHNMAALTMNAKSIAEDCFFTVCAVENDQQKQQSSPESRTAVSDVYRFGPSGIKLLRPVTLAFKYDEQLSSSTIGIYRKDGSNWIYVEGYINPQNHTIVVQTDKLGDFQIQQGDANGSNTPAIPTSYSLSQNYPNPFNPTTKIQYGLPDDCDVTLMVYNMLGREVATLVRQQQTAGNYQIDWNANLYTSGIYFYKIDARSVDGKNKFLMIRKMTVIK